MVLADDLGFGDLASYGATRIPTPHTDRLAAEGVRFTDAHTSGGVCHPSRYALLTGRHYWRSPQAMAAFAERRYFGFMPQMVEHERVTLPEALRGAGYATYMVGKWHLGMDWATAGGARAERGGEKRGLPRAGRGRPARPRVRPLVRDRGLARPAALRVPPRPPAGRRRAPSTGRSRAAPRAAPRPTGTTGRSARRSPRRPSRS